ncbi:hypothetical protein TNCV_1071901 [Trichonephila clavipes]|nr:hypothetical protein TNCV_1071901 [Trichonephila clavipes]
MEAGWSAKRVARQLGRYWKEVLGPVDPRNVTYTKTRLTGRLRQTSRREDRYISKKSVGRLFSHLKIIKNRSTESCCERKNRSQSVGAESDWGGWSKISQPNPLHFPTSQGIGMGSCVNMIEDNSLPFDDDGNLQDKCGP